jgi:tRNA(Ile)-lysidine synthase
MSANFRHALARSWPAEAWQRVTVLVAVSGGADSVALLRGLAELKRGGAGRLVVAHFNHRWRGAQSDGDEAFVNALAANLGLSVEVGRAESALAKGPSCNEGETTDRPPSDSARRSERTTLGGEGPEALARRARYDFLLTAAERVGARYVATAHTADDQAETILQRIVRGTGIAGLAGIPRVRPLSPAVTLIRPLLDVPRPELLAFLRELQQPYREDASNADVRFTRNRLRHELLPRLARDYNPHVHESLLRLGSLAAEAQAVVDQQVDALLQHVERPCAARVCLNCLALATASDFLLRELLARIWREQRWPLQAMTHGKWCELAALARGTEDTRDFPGSIRAEKQGEWLVLTRSA